MPSFEDNGILVEDVSSIFVCSAAAVRTVFRDCAALGK